MGIIVNATEAARLVGVSERTMRAWLDAGKIAGADKHQTPGKGPASWAIDTDALGDIDEAALAALQAQRSGVTADILTRLHAIEQQLAALKERAPYLFAPVTHSAPNLGERSNLDLSPQSHPPESHPRASYVAPVSSDGVWLSQRNGQPSANARGKWVEGHGGPGRSFVREWADVREWRGPEDAIVAVRRRPGRHDWQPRECTDPSCLCHELLGS